MRPALVFAVFTICIVASNALFGDVNPYGQRVESIPGLGDVSALGLWTGYLPVDVQASNLFYWFAESQSNPATDPVILWLNGGPGCSSMTGFFVENGPFQFVALGNASDLRLQLNPYSWTSNASVVWIDQPVGTGMSFASTNFLQNNETLMAQSLYNALVHFFLDAHPDFKANPFYIAGESYAGKYIPRLATFTLAANKQNPPYQINLQGVLIGDGLVDPVSQRLVVVDQAYANGLISYEQRLQVQGLNDICVQAIAVGDMARANVVCEAMYEFVDVAAGGGLNEYDLRNFDPFSSAQIENYLNLPEVRNAIHVVSAIPFVGCSDAVGNQLALWRMLSVAPMIPALASEIRVLLYNGNFDLKDGPLGTERYLANLNMSGWEWTPRNVWYHNNKVAGWIRTLGNLSFVNVFGAGHFVPTTQPENSLVMLTAFLNNEAFCIPSTPSSQRRRYIPAKDGQVGAAFDHFVSCAPAASICAVLNNCSYPNGACSITGQCFCTADYTGADCSNQVFSVPLPQPAKSIHILPFKWTYIKFEVTTASYAANILFTRADQYQNNPVDISMLLSKGKPPTYHEFLRADTTKAAAAYSFKAEMTPGTYYVGIYAESHPQSPVQAFSGEITISQVTILEGSSALVVVIVLAAIAAISLASTIVVCIKLNCAVHKEAYQEIN